MPSKAEDILNGFKLYPYFIGILVVHVNSALSYGFVFHYFYRLLFCPVLYVQCKYFRVLTFFMILCI